MDYDKLCEINERDDNSKRTGTNEKLRIYKFLLCKHGERREVCHSKAPRAQVEANSAQFRGEMKHTAKVDTRVSQYILSANSHLMPKIG